MKIGEKLKNYFTPFEIILLLFSEITVITSFILWDGTNYFNLICSAIGLVSVILCAKGNPLGGLIGIAFSVMYSISSYKFGYYGELITYSFMSLPMYVVSFISWLKNPYKKGELVVKVNKMKKFDYYFMVVSALLVTVAFYFVLRYFNTTNLIPSTISITTSYFAMYLMAKRIPLYAVAYALNDIVLVVLWVLASFTSLTYLTLTVCFAVFFINDIYSFINWRRMEKLQKFGKNESNNLLDKT